MQKNLNRLPSLLRLTLMSFFCLALCACEKSPSGIVSEWKNAIASGKVEKANKLSTEESAYTNALIAAILTDETKKSELERFTGAKITREEIDEKTARVFFSNTEARPNPIRLKKVNGSWKIDLVMP